MIMAALMVVIMMLFVVNMLVLMHLPIMLMGMDVFIACMAAHLFSPPILLSQRKLDKMTIKALLLLIIARNV